MADGDAAAAAGYTVAPNTTAANLIANLIARVQDDLANKTGNKGAVIPIAKGGTGGATAAAALAALGALPASDVVISDGSVTIAGKVPRYTEAGRMIAGAPSGPTDVANKAYVDAQVPPAFNGGVVTGQIYLPNAFAASSGYTIAYINGDGRISEGASSERFKDDITEIEPASLGDLFPQLHTFVMKDDPGKVLRVGYIAERLEESDDLRPFVVYERVPVVNDDGEVVDTEIARDADGNTIPKSIDFISLFIAQIAQLEARVKVLEAEKDHG